MKSKTPFVRKLIAQERHARNLANVLLCLAAGGQDGDEKELAALRVKGLVDGAGFITERGRNVAAKIREGRAEDGS